MKVIDARSGQEMKIGDTASYPDGESVTLLDFYPGLFSASALVRIRYRAYPSNEIVTSTREEPLTVRWLHPSYRFQHVAFINS